MNDTRLPMNLASEGIDLLMLRISEGTALSVLHILGPDSAVPSGSAGSNRALPSDVPGSMHDRLFFIKPLLPVLLT